MLGTIAVKHMAMEANIKPARKEKKGTRRKNGLGVKRATVMTPKTMEELMRLLVAPHKISPAITSSRLTGVAMIASKVF